jgi:hypothetical protein
VLIHIVRVDSGLDYLFTAIQLCEWCDGKGAEGRDFRVKFVLRASIHSIFKLKRERRRTSGSASLALRDIVAS